MFSGKKRDSPNQKMSKKDRLPSPKTLEGKMAFLKKLKEISRKHVDEIESKSNDTCITTELSTDSERNDRKTISIVKQSKNLHILTEKDDLDSNGDTRIFEDRKESETANDELGDNGYTKLKEEENKGEMKMEQILVEESNRNERKIITSNEHCDVFETTKEVKKCESTPADDHIIPSAVSNLTQFFTKQKLDENIVIVSEGLNLLKERTYRSYGGITSIQSYSDVLRNYSSSLQDSCGSLQTCEGCTEFLQTNDDIHVKRRRDGKAQDVAARLQNNISPQRTRTRGGRHNPDRDVTCADIAIDDDYSLSNVSGITMQTLLRDELRRQSVRHVKEIHDINEPDGDSDDLSFDAAVETLRTISAEMGIPFKDLMNGQGLQQVARRHQRNPNNINLLT